MKKIITILAVALMALSACNKEGGRMPGMTEYIAFESYAGGMTKTAALNTANLSTFGAAAYTGSVEIMNNQLVEDGNGAWNYTPIKYWPQSGALYFSAYAPYATASNGITPSYNTATKSFDLTYVMPADEADQVDLLMAQNVDVEDCSNRPAKVQFTFGHILSRIGLTARYTGNVSAGTTVTLTDVKVSGKFMASGDYTVSGGWANQAASASTVVYDRPAAKLAATGLTTSAQNLLAGDNYVMVIPNGSVAMEGTITVYYTITSPDGVSMEYVKDASSPLSYEPNKTYIYNLIIDLDADAIEFGDVTVNDWGTSIEMDVPVRTYSHKLEIEGLRFSTAKKTAFYKVKSQKIYDDGEVVEIPWTAEFSSDGNSYSDSVPGFFDKFVSNDSASGEYIAATSEDSGSIYVKFLQNESGKSVVKNLEVTAPSNLFAGYLNTSGVVPGLSLGNIGIVDATLTNVPPYYIRVMEGSNVVQSIELHPDENGYFEEEVPDLLPGQRFSFAQDATARYSLFSFQSLGSMIEKITIFPDILTNGTDYSDMFTGCVCLQSFPYIDLGGATIATNFIGKVDVVVVFTTVSLTSPIYECEGFGAIKCDLDLRYTRLDHDSLMRVINQAGTVTDKTLTLGPTLMAKLSADEIAVATGKGWTVE